MTSKTLIKCPYCGSDKVSKNGHSKAGKQVYNCNNKACTHKNSIETYTNKAYQPDMRNQVLKMAVKGTGTRATGHIPGISKDTVTAILKKHKTGPVK
jgi:transposase-like protein